MTARTTLSLITLLAAAALTTATGLPVPADVEASGLAEPLEIGPLGVPDSPEPSGPVTASLDPIVTVRNATPARLLRLAEALSRFGSAGLALPDLEIAFPDAGIGCSGHMGVFRDAERPWKIEICTDGVDSVYEHELAHAWERANLTEQIQQAFTAFRGHTVWSSHDVPWNERGVEGAAFVIQQGVSGPPLPPALSDEHISRLQAYELLTGRPAPQLERWIEMHRVPCGSRPTDLSRTTGSDATGPCGSAAEAVAR